MNPSSTTSTEKSIKSAEYDLIRLLNTDVPPESLTSAFWDRLPDDSKAAFRLLCKEACQLSERELIWRANVLLSQSSEIGDVFSFLQRLPRLSTLDIRLPDDDDWGLAQHNLVQLLSLGKHLKSLNTLNLHGWASEGEESDDILINLTRVKPVVLQSIGRRLSQLQSLTLHHLRIPGGALTALSSCRHLIRLQLSHVSVEDDILEDVAKLQQLVSLDASVMDLVGHAHISSLQALSALQHLQLANTYATGLSDLSSMTQLTSLTLDDVANIDDSDDNEGDGEHDNIARVYLGGLTALQQLTITGCQWLPFTDTTPLGQLKQLTSLTFGKNPCHLDLDWRPGMPPPFIHMKQIKLLGFKGVRELHSLLHMAPNLQCFYWDHNEFGLKELDVTAAPRLAAEQQLQEVAQRLAQIPVTVSGLQLSLREMECTRLQQLMPSLQPMSSLLQTLILSGLNGMECMLATTICNTLPSLASLAFSKVTLANHFVLPAISKLGKLKELRIVNCRGDIQRGDVFALAAKRPDICFVVEAPWWTDDAEEDLERVRRAALGGADQD